MQVLHTLFLGDGKPRRLVRTMAEYESLEVPEGAVLDLDGIIPDGDIPQYHWELGYRRPEE